MCIRDSIGGTWHVSLNSKFPTVDIRRWYEDSRTELKPTRVGIALTYSNWDKLKWAVIVISGVEVFPDRCKTVVYGHGQSNLRGTK